MWLRTHGTCQSMEAIGEFLPPWRGLLCLKQCLEEWTWIPGPKVFARKLYCSHDRRLQHSVSLDFKNGMEWEVQKNYQKMDMQAPRKPFRSGAPCLPDFVDLLSFYFIMSPWFLFACQGRVKWFLFLFWNMTDDPQWAPFVFHFDNKLDSLCESCFLRAWIWSVHLDTTSVKNRLGAYSLLSHFWDASETRAPGGITRIV